MFDFCSNSGAELIPHWSIAKPYQPIRAQCDWARVFKGHTRTSSYESSILLDPAIEKSVSGLDKHYITSLVAVELWWGWKRQQRHALH